MTVDEHLAMGARVLRAGPAPSDKDEVARIENPSKSSSHTRRHKQMFVAPDIDFADEVKVTQPKQILDAVRAHRVVHWAKGTSATPDDIRRFVGTIYVWERW